ncbi:MAG TPA: efflux RND transporter periplasmic adaptor subunit [Gammaproteobacteria bacterium]|nr:efflux RND transporter periplasmic adaptor subunit [Gammaproteobacteria bacterium]
MNNKVRILDKLQQRHKKSPYALYGLIGAVALVVIIVAVKGFQIKAMIDSGAQMMAMMPPTPVNAVEVKEQDWQPRVSSVGTVEAVQGTVISAEAEGTVREISFEAGSMVKTGDKLVQLDVDIEQAQLRSAEAAAEGAQLTYNRAKELIKTKNVSQADFNAANVAYKQALAQVDNIKALIAKKTLRAPFDGKLGIREISVGQFLQKGNPVVSLYSMSPVYVEFSLPQQRLGDTTEGLTVTVSSDAHPGKQFTGLISAINPDIDPATRNVRVQATLPNGEGLLRPGMFVTVDMVLARKEKVLFIPSTAVVYAPFGDSVFLIAEGKPGPDGAKSLTVQQQFVKLGARQGDFVAATEGLKPGQQIVSTGVFKLRPGMGVVIDNTLEPKFTLAPQPNNT